MTNKQVLDIELSIIENEFDEALQKIEEAKTQSQRNKILLALAILLRKQNKSLYRKLFNNNSNLILSKSSAGLFSKSFLGKAFKKVFKRRDKMIKYTKIFNRTINKIGINITNILAKDITKIAKANNITKLFKKAEKTFKQIAIRDSNYYKNTSSILSADKAEKNGDKVTKIWIHGDPLEPRETHLAANGQTVVGADTLFNIGGTKVIAPYMFGDPSEDINCTCTVDIIITNKND